MNYRFDDDVSISEYESFILNVSNAPIFQSVSWAGVKENWKKRIIGVRDENDTLVLATLLLYRNVGLNFSFGYCNRGPIGDLKEDIFKVFSSGLDLIGKKLKLAYIKIDPLVPYEITRPDIPETSYFYPYENIDSYKQINDIIVSNGFIHKGFGKVLSDYIQPRYNTIVPLKDCKRNPLTADQLKKNFRPSIRKYVGVYAEKRGIFSEIIDVNDDNLTEFTRLIHCTETRQNIYLRGKEYFKNLTDSYGDNAKILFAKCNISKYLEYLYSRKDNEPENLDKIQPLIEEAVSTMSERGEVVTLAGMLIVLPPNNSGIKQAEYLYTGADLSVFSSFHITLIGLYEAMLFCINSNIDLLNLGGVEGTLDDGLYEFKSKFCPILVEYYGEYDYIVSKFKYNLMEKYMPKVIRIYKKVVRKIKGTENKVE